MNDETAEERARRESRRLQFDGVAEIYHRVRRGYSARLLDEMVATARVAAGDPVLEVGCGTGQLTRQLQPFGFDLTAIDIGPTMVVLASRHLDAAAVAFEVTSYEAFDAEPESYALIVSGTAFHWVDPVIGFEKAARLLRRGGWLSLLYTGERYDEPFASKLADLWQYWPGTKAAPVVTAMEDSGFFGELIEARDEERLTLPVEQVLGVEMTRATYLSYEPARQAEFEERLRGLLDGRTSVGLTQETALHMACVRRP